MTKRKYLILLVLCLGYFIDFYDLTVLSVSYVDLFKHQFNIIDNTVIQQTYYLVNNVQMVGILLGAVLFGILADKFGRITVIKYSILLYSVTTLLSIFTTNFYMFLGFRFLAYLALASEFAVSTVLIIEFFPKKIAAWGMSLLYILGVLGGITATAVGSVSWKLMFIVGGLAGLLIYIFRNSLEESPEFKKMYERHQTENAGSILFLLKNYNKPLILNLLITIPYFFTISVMFAMIKFIIVDIDFGVAIKLFLFGFFAGNIISCIFSGFYNQYFNSPNKFFVFNIILFLFVMLGYGYVDEKHLTIFGLLVGFLGGGYNVMWAQYSSTEFPTKVRALAVNSIFALGRASTILLGVLFAYLVTDKTLFSNGVYLLAVAIAVMVLTIIIFYKRKNILVK